MKYLILDVFKEVPHLVAAVMAEPEAKEYVKKYCNKFDLTYKGLYNKEYQGISYEHCFLQITPLDDKTSNKLGFYWDENEEQKLETINKN